MIALGLRQVTPFIHVSDFSAAVAFFEELLGFTVQLRADDYAYVEREGCAFRLYQNHGDNGAPPGNRRFAYYIDCADVDHVYRELKFKLDLLPSSHVHGPADKPYGQRELCILAPDGNVLTFGSPMAAR